MTVSRAPSSFTCASCHALFDTAELHRGHYQSDWHRYNLRRKVSDLPPVVESVYLQRAGQLKEATERQNVPEAASYACSSCAKAFSTENSHLNHLKSKRHLENASKRPPVASEAKSTKKTERAQSPEQDAFIDAEASAEVIREAIEAKLALSKRLRLEDCIFCRHASESFEHNMEHMTKEHGLYIPDIDFIADLSGLVGYLADKVAVGHCCIYCPAIVQPFSSLEAVRKHMIDKGHLKIRYDEEGMDELADFYDYEEILIDDGDDEYVDISNDEDADYLAQGDEGAEDLVQGDEDELSTALVISPDESELILPSGKRLGHRAYRHACRQSVHEQSFERPTRRSEHKALIERISDHYFASGLASVEEQRRYVVDQRRNDEHFKEWDMKLGQRANKLQEHFRHQLRQ